MILKKIVIYIFVLLLISNYAFAISDYQVVVDQSNNKDTLGNIIDQAKALRNQKDVKRGNFQTLSSYNNQVKENSLRLEEHLSRIYLMTFTPSKVSLDWENSAVIIRDEFPAVLQRPRGGGDRFLHVLITTSPDKARLISTFPGQIIVNIYFKLNNLLHIEANKITILSGGEIIYEEF